MWRLSGLHRHVTLRSVAASASIGDIRVTTPLEWSSSSNSKSTSSSAPGHVAAAATAAVPTPAAAAGSAAAAEGGGPASALTKAQLCVEVLLEVDTHHLSQQHQQAGAQQQSSLSPPAAGERPTGEGAPGAPCGLQLEVVLMSAEGEVLVPAVTAAWEQVRCAV
jgi:hypothetical protein